MKSDLIQIMVLIVHGPVFDGSILVLQCITEQHTSVNEEMEQENVKDVRSIKLQPSHSV